MAHERRVSAFRLIGIVLFWIAVQLSAQETVSSSHARDLVDIVELQQLARNGDGHAAYLVGRAYMDGTGVDQDLQQAIAWFALATANGSADGDFGLGYLYEHGPAIPSQFSPCYGSL